MSTTFRSINFNDLPDEIHQMTFDLFTPIERTLISPTCKKFYDLIMESKSWWREVEVEESGLSMDKIKAMLQFFSRRSHNSLKKVSIKRSIETEEELEDIFSLIQSSSSTIKWLEILQSRDFNTLTRRFSQDLPNIKILQTTGQVLCGLQLKYPGQLSSNGIGFFETDLLEELDEEDFQWLSRLSHLCVILLSSHSPLQQILRACRRRLRVMIFKIFIAIEMPFEMPPIESIQMECLQTLHLPCLQDDVPAVIFPLSAPNLRDIRGRLSQVKAVSAPSLKVSALSLEDEGVDGWDREEIGTFTDQIKGLFIQWSGLRSVDICLLDDRECNAQYQVMVELLYCCEDSEQVPLCPGLQRLVVKPWKSGMDAEKLTRTVISRERYRLNAFGVVDFQIGISESGERLKQETMDQFVKARKQVESLKSLEDYA